MDYFYSEYNGNFFPSDFFKLLSSLFEIAKSFDSERKTKFFEKIVELFEQGQEIYKNFILKYFNELFEILIYSKIDQNNNVKAKGMILDNILEDSLKNNNDIFDLEKFEKLLVEKININQPILTGFLFKWISIIIPLSSEKNFLEKVFIDFIPWIIKAKNSGEIVIVIKLDNQDFDNYIKK